MLLLDNVDRKIEEDVSNLIENENFEGDCGIHTIEEVGDGMRRTVDGILATRMNFKNN